MALAVPALAVADTLEKVGESGVFTIGYRQDAAPFSMMRADGKADGYSVELCLEIAKAVGSHLGRSEIQVDFKPVTVENRFAALAEGEIDILCGATSVTMSRRESMDFTLLTFVTGAGVMVRADSSITGMGDTAGKRIGVLGGTTTEEALRNTLEGERITADVVTFGDRPAGFDALLSGDIDAFFGDRELLLGLAVTRGDPDKVQLFSRYLTIEPYALAIPHGEDELRLVADRALARIYRTGYLDTIYGRWFTGTEPGDLLKALVVLQGLPE
jgi:ABC-type amino acid transport substrate-binding protein